MNHRIRRHDDPTASGVTSSTAPGRDRLRRRVPLGHLLAIVAATAGLTLAANGLFERSGPSAAAQTSPDPTAFVPIDPERVFDSRVDDTFGGDPGDPLGAGQIVEIAGALTAAGVPEDAIAVTFAVQVTATTGSGYVEVTSRPDLFGVSSTVSWIGAGQRASSGGVVGLGPGPTDRSGFFVQFGGGDDLPQGHVIIDVTGYHISAA